MTNMDNAPVSNTCSSNTASKSKSNSKNKANGKSVVPPPKLILMSPFAASLPTYFEENIEEVKQELQKCTTGMKRNELKPKWSELKSVEKSKRNSFCREYKNKLVGNMKDFEQEAFLKAEKELEVKWNDIVLGFNSIMRHLERDDICAVLVKKNMVPDTLALMFVPVCMAKDVPLVPIDDLDVVLKNDSCLGLKHSCIAVGLKKIVSQTTESNFYSLYEKIIGIWGTRSMFGELPQHICVSAKEREKEGKKNSENELQDFSDKRNRKTAIEPLSPLDISKYILSRNIKLDRAFVPGMGLNKIAKMPDVDYIRIGKEDDGRFECDDPISITGELRPKRSFEGKPYKKPLKDGYQRKQAAMATLEEVGSMNDKPIQLDTSTDMFFTLDLGGEADSDNNSMDVESKAIDGEPCISPHNIPSCSKTQKTKRLKKTSNSKTLAIKRKTTDTSYIAATVKKFKANINRKK